MHNSHRVDSDGREAWEGVYEREAEHAVEDRAPARPARGSGEIAARRSGMVARSRRGRLALVGPRELYATSDVIAAANDALVGARLYLMAGATWQAAPALRRVLPALCAPRVRGALEPSSDAGVLTRGISDDLVHPILRSFAPLRGDAPAARALKLDKYRRFWEAQETMMLALSIAISQFQSHMYRARLEQDLPRVAPGYTTSELRACVTENARKIAIDGYLGTFFQALVTRNLLDACAPWLPAFEAACHLRDRITQTMTQISDEIEADGELLIAPGRGADLTALLHAPSALEALPLGELDIVLRDGEDAVTLQPSASSLPIGRRAWTFALRP